MLKNRNLALTVFRAGRNLGSDVGWTRAYSRLLAIFLVTAALAFGFIEVGSEAMEGETHAFDKWVLSALRSSSDPAVPIGPAWFNTAVADLTALGSFSVLILTTALCAGYLVVVRRPLLAAYLSAAITLGLLGSTILKLAYSRTRPDVVEHLVQTDSASFPSGHAMNAALTYLTLAALLAGAEPNNRIRVYLMAAALCLTILIGLTRVYLGVHWPTDVIGGWCIGGAWAVLCSYALVAAQKRYS